MADSARELATEPTREMRTSDPYPWLFIDYDGEETRVHSIFADEDGNDRIFEGWVYSPRSAEELAEHE